MRWFLVAAAAAAMCLTDCGARAAQVDFTCTLPAFRADSTNCQLSSADSLKDLATVVVYVSTTAALADSALVLTQGVPGQEGKLFNFSAQQPTWTTRWYWLVTRDSRNGRACRSNAVARTVYGGPPGRVTDLRAR